MNPEQKWERFLKQYVESPRLKEVIQGPRQTKGFPHEQIRVMGRPKKLRKWGFNESNDKPRKVVKIL